MNKRTQILKQLACERLDEAADNQIASQAPINESKLLGAEAKLELKDTLQHHALLNDGLRDELSTVANQLHIKEQYLQIWLGTFPHAPALSKLALLRLMQKYELDPFLEEVDLVQYEDQSWQAVITTQGYARLMNACPQFKGMTYSYSGSSNDAITDWIECSIYRADRDSPITVREYYLETRRDSVAWQKMPRRMLRNRAFQQCAKMALGI
jgi:hypothetical protein